MMFKQLIISTLVFAPSIVWAANIGQTVGQNQAFQTQTNSDDEDVKAVNALSALRTAQKVATDIQNLASGLQSATTNTQGTPPTSDPGTEDTVTNSFTAFCNVVPTYMSDLVDKEGTLETFGQQAAIYQALQNLRTGLTNYSEAVENVVGDTTHKNNVDQSSSNAIVAVVDALDEYEPETLRV